MRQYLENHTLKQLYTRVLHGTGFLHRDSEVIRELVANDRVVVHDHEKYLIFKPFAELWNKVYFES